MDQTKTVNSIITEPLTNLQQTSEGNWLCDICGHIEELKEDLLTHRILHFSNEHPKQCPICKKTFSSPTSLRNHLTVHTGIKKYRCKYCSRKFGWKAQLVTHENLHTGKGLHHCHICSKSFMTKWLLQRHLKIHEKGLQRHKKETTQIYISTDVHNKVDPAMLSSPRLNKKQLREISMTMRQRIDNSKLCQLCNECNERFASKEDLAFHLLKHNSSKQNTVSSPRFKTNEVTYNKNGEDPDGTLSTVDDTMNEELESPEIDYRSKLLNTKPPMKGSLTSIVSKLHHKVDEKQKFENDDDIEVQVLGSSDQNNFIPIEDQNIQKNHEFSILVQSNQHMSKSTDPFISGIVENVLTNGAPTTTSNVSTNRMDFEKSIIDNYIRKQTAKLNERISSLKNDLLEQKVNHSQELSALHGKIDSLTNLISSQSLMLNRIILGGKMSVSGTLDFCVQQNTDE